MVFVIFGAWKGVAGIRGDAQAFARNATHAICETWDADEYRKRASEAGNEMFGDAELKELLQSGQYQFGKLRRISFTRASAPASAARYWPETGTMVQVTLECRFSKADRESVELWCVENTGRWKISAIWFPGLTLPPRAVLGQVASWLRFAEQYLGDIKMITDPQIEQLEGEQRKSFEEGHVQSIIANCRQSESQVDIAKVEYDAIPLAQQAKALFRAEAKVAEDFRNERKSGGVVSPAILKEVSTCQQQLEELKAAAIKYRAAHLKG